MARLTRPAWLFERWRCWWSWPLGHAWELVDYFDAVAGKWAARSHCVRCGHETGLAIGRARSGAIFSNPLNSALLSPSTSLSVPGSHKVGPMPVAALLSGFVVESPDLGEVAVRHVRVRHPLGIRRNVYCAWRPGDSAAPAVATDLRVALARAAERAPSDPWVLRVARQLEDELTANPS